MEDKKIQFTHLHVHTEYSLLDGSAKIGELLDRAKELGMDSLAITDHGAMFGAVEFYKAAKERGIHPIIGCEVYVANGSRLRKEGTADHKYYHLVLLAENETGYENLIKLVSFGYLDGYYYKPRVDLELLETYHEGIIASSACLAGEVARNLIQVSYERAKEAALRYDKIFGHGNFFLELQDHGLRDQKLVNQQLLRMSEETEIPLICTNDSHYIYKEDSVAHDILLCIQTGKTVADENRMRYAGSEFYLKSPEEMYELFSYAPQALENTAKIAARCQVDFTFHQLKLPKFHVPAGMTAQEYLRKICLAGFEKKYPQATDEMRQRLEYELHTIESMGYVDYFLIVWDFIRFAKENGIVVGPGRGSAAGSMVSYSLDITTIDPLKYDLIFERFLNPERVSMPDIDVDFCFERRQEVIDYVVQKYGEDHVAQIVTFGTLAARAAIKDVGRALAMPYGDVDRVSKMVPRELGITIKKALHMNPEMKKAYDEDEDIHKLIDMSLRLEGLPRHCSTHAAGVVICGKPVMDYVPLSTNDGAVNTQYTMTILEELGLLKMDFLGLRTLTVIQNAAKEIARTHGIHIDLDALDDGDPKVYELMCQGKTEGVFQLESSGMKSFMKELKPSCLEDLIAGISLYRPGPMDFIPKYVKGKNNQQEIQYTHESLRPILKNTYGCIVYQEQVMQIVRDLAGYSLGRSDLVRRAMSKKKAKVMAEERKNFVYGTEGVPGCVANGIPAETAEKIFDEMTDFAKYAFNKSHAACYAVVGYQTAWLKTYYPVEFMAALMTSVMDNSDKVSDYIEECRSMGVSLLPPDVNEGFSHFSVANGKIRYSLAAIKNVGRSVIEAVTKEREQNGLFVSLNDFCTRMGSLINKRCMESMIKAGAFDSLGGSRAQYMLIYKGVMDGVGQAKKNNIDGQMNLFDMMGEKEETLKDELPPVKEYPVSDKLAMEKEVLGVYVSGHPLAEYEAILKRKVSCTSADLAASGREENEEDSFQKINDGDWVTVGGIIMDKTIKYTRNGNQPMAFVRIEDLRGPIEVVIFPKDYEKYGTNLLVNQVVVVEGRANLSDDDSAKLAAAKISFLNEGQMEEQPVKKIGVVLKDGHTLGEILPLVMEGKGYVPLYINDTENGKKFKADEKYWMNPDSAAITKLRDLLGDDAVILI